MTEPGWHPDPLGEGHRERYFDGATWTTRTRQARDAEAAAGARGGGRLVAALAGVAILVVVVAGVWGAGGPALINPPVTVAPPSPTPTNAEPPRFDCVPDGPARLPAARATDAAPAAGWAGPVALAYPFARAAGLFTDRAPARFPVPASRSLLIVGELDQRSSQGWYQSVAEQLIACVAPTGYHVNNSTVTSTTDDRGPFEVESRISRAGQDTRPAMLARVVLVAQGEGVAQRYGFLLWRAPVRADTALRALRQSEDRFLGRR